MAMLWFYCDESYDNPAKTYCVAGLFGEMGTFEKLVANWNGINDRFGVECYHGTEINAFTGEFSDWDSYTSAQYSRRLLRAIERRGKSLMLAAIAMHSDEYEKHISEEGRARFGHPYIACFKTCLIMLATSMRSLSNDWKFSVIFERNEHTDEAIRVFNLLKETLPEYGLRMGTCSSGNWKQNVALQPADLVAYESMRRLRSMRSNGKFRRALDYLLGKNSSMGFYLDGSVLEGFKHDLESSEAKPGNFFYTAKQFYPEYEDGNDWEEIERKVAEHDRRRQV